jgi:hypothetical protein
MDIRTFAELTAPDERTLRFTPLGLATGGKLNPENAAEFQQHSIAAADLVPTIPEGTRSSFERLRTLHTYGVLCYDLFTVVADLTWVVLEQALRERFIEFYEGMIPLVGTNGAESSFPAPDFEAVNTAFRRGGSHAKGWQLQLRSQGTLTKLPLTLGPLLRWAREEGLLHGQRNRRVEEVLFDKIRNRFAHGSSFRIGMPNQSARAICDLAEIINRLWGKTTPGGRLYPAPLHREVLAVGWSPIRSAGEQGSSLDVMHAEQLAGQTEPDDWMYLIMRGVWHGEWLAAFDARYELTTYPTDLLWGPGNRHDALAWLEATAPVGDEVDYLDRVFAIRRHDGKVYPPCRAEVLLGLPKEHQAGTWHIIRADFPGDCFAHVRHIETGQSCGPSGQIPTRCAVQEITEGSWADVTASVMKLSPSLQPAEYTEVWVPLR